MTTTGAEKVKFISKDSDIYSESGELLGSNGQVYRAGTLFSCCYIDPDDGHASVRLFKSNVRVEAPSTYQIKVDDEGPGEDARELYRELMRSKGKAQ